MKELTPQQHRKLKKLGNLVDKGNVAILEHLFEIEEQIEDSQRKIEERLPLLENIIEKVKGKDADPRIVANLLKQDKVFLKEVTPEDGKDYVLTLEDKQEIAKKVTVPVVEKVIQRTEVIRELPTITKETTHEVREVLDVNALPQHGEKFRDGLELLQGDERLSKDAIKGLDAELDRIEQQTRKRETNFGFVIRDLVAGTNITIDKSIDPHRPTINATGGGSGITRTIVSTSGNTTMAAVASTDYVYIVTGAHTMTLPTAVGNTNRYTVRNNHSASITVNTTSSQDIKGSVTATSYSVYNGDARSFISDNVAWNIV